MRIPQVGESGWQVSHSQTGEWFGCEIVCKGAFYMALCPADCDFTIAIPGHESTTNPDGYYSAALKDLRRKPQQTDTQAADESFQRDLKQMLAPSRVRS